MDTFQQLKNYSLEVVLTINEKKKYLMYTIKDINPYPTAFPPGKGNAATHRFPRDLLNCLWPFKYSVY